MPEQKPFQVYGSAWLRKTPHALLADDPGLGKSNQALVAAQGETLIMSPARLAGTWEEEIAKWRPDLDITWCSYSSLTSRVKEWNGSKFVSRSTSRPRVQYVKHWDTVICDEAHHLKNSKTRWTQAALRVIGKSDRTYLLTGTPIRNWAQELFIPLQILHPGDRRYTSYWRWVKEWFSLWEMPWGGVRIMGLRKDRTWEQFYVGNDLDTLMLRRDRRKVLPELPPLTKQDVLVSMTPAQRKTYDQFKKEYHAWIDETGKEISAWSDGGRCVKLEQLTTGLEVVDLAAHGSGKLKAMCEQLADYGNDFPVVIYGVFRNTIHAIERDLKKLGRDYGVIMGGVLQKKRDEMRRSFQAGNLSTIVGTLDTLSEGLTLTHSHVCLFIEHSWVPSVNSQGVDRLLRIGQEEPVTALDYWTENSLDQRMGRLLDMKTDQQMRALSARELAGLL